MKQTRARVCFRTLSISIIDCKSRNEVDCGGLLSNRWQYSVKGVPSVQAEAKVVWRTGHIVRFKLKIHEVCL